VASLALSLLRLLLAHLQMVVDLPGHDFVTPLTGQRLPFTLLLVGATSATATAATSATVTTSRIPQLCLGDDFVDCCGQR